MIASEHQSHLADFNIASTELKHTCFHTVYAVSENDTVKASEMIDTRKTIDSPQNCTSRVQVVGAQAGMNAGTHNVDDD